jgi:hypothetical protein
MYNNCLGREDILILLGLCSGLWCLKPLSTIFQLYREPVLLVEETVEYPEKTENIVESGAKHHKSNHRLMEMDVIFEGRTELPPSNNISRYNMVYTILK